MADWTNPPWAQLVAGKAWTDEKAAASFENPIAITEGAPGSPYEYAVWRPYNSAAWGDGNTGLLYDSATDGTVANIITPEFEAGWDYRLIFEDLRGTFTGSPARLLMRLYWAGAWQSTADVSGTLATGTSRVFGWIDLIDPAGAWFTKISQSTLADMAGVGIVLANPTTLNPIWRGDNAVAATQAQIMPVTTLGNFTFGKVWMMRRRSNGPTPR